MKTLLGSFLILAITPALPLQAQIIDDFSTADAGNYNATVAYNGANNGSPASFSVNGSGQLQPGSSASNTTIFLRNTGQLLSDATFGQSVSLDILSVSNPATDDGSQLGASSLGFSLSLSPTPSPDGSAYSVDDFELGILRLNGGYLIASSNTSIPQATIPLAVNFAAGSVTETITRTGDNSFLLSFSGPGLTTAFTALPFTVNGSIATGHGLYFGPDVFGGNTSGSQIVDNLAFNSAPEPSTYAMLGLGLAGLVFLARRRLA